MADLVKKKTLESFADYADKHKIYEKFQYLVRRIVLAKPNDPIQFMIDALQKPKTCAILVHGPPSSGQTQICENISRIFDAVHIRVGSMIRAAIDKQTMIGIQMKTFVEKGQLVPDSIIINLVFARLQEPDVAAKGFVLEGFPRTREQALAMQRKGILADNMVIFDSPDEVVISRAAGLRYDPVTNKTYHLKFDPPPRNPQIESRLIKNVADTESSIKHRLSIFKRNLPGIKSALGDTCSVLNYSEGIFGNEELIYKEIFTILGRKPISRTPRYFKILISGLPGSGKTKVAEMIRAKYGMVHVSPRTVILEEMSNDTALGAELEQYLKDPESAPVDVMMDAIAARLRQPDCVNNGWVLEGFPTNKAQLSALQKYDISPNRIFWLQASFETCRTRLADRRYSPETGKIVNLKHLPESLNESLVSAWPIRPRDAESKVQARLNDSKGLRTELEKAFGVRTTEESAGILQEIDANGIGEADDLGRQPSLERVYELIESALLRPVAINYKLDDI